VTQFTLNIQIDTSGVISLANAQMSVAILQAVPNSQYLVIAALAKPEQNMIISWDDSVYIYTSSYPLKGYTTLLINSWLEALSGNLYSFNESTITCIGQGWQGSVQIKNQNISHTNNPVTAGLANVFTVNSNKQPLAITTAVSVLYNGLATFQISNNFWLTALSESQVGRVIPPQVIPNVSNALNNASNVLSFMSFLVSVAQPALLLEFSDDNANKSVTYNDQQNKFILQT
jgi:hypothetical protein